jgi:hypothetical protein
MESSKREREKKKKKKTKTRLRGELRGELLSKFKPIVVVV